MLCLALTGAGSPGAPATLPGTPSRGVSAAQLREAAAARVLFGHQSVGWNILGGVEARYAGAGVTGLRVLQVDSTVPAGSGGVFAHAEIGSNGDPRSKMAAFEALVQASGSGLDAALMKLCYVDVTSGVAVEGVFRDYRAMIARLQARFPSLVLLHATVPLTVDSPADNVARQRYNALMRRAYGSSGRLVDIAKAESTTPSGQRVGGRNAGVRYFALWSGYAADEGHLNSRGASAVAAVLLQRIAAAT